MFPAQRLVTLALLLSALPGAATAASAVVAGTFDGAEPKAPSLFGRCDGDDPLAWQQAGTLQVSVSGAYTVLDVLYLDGAKYNGVDLTILLYSGEFDIDSPSTNLVRPNPAGSGAPSAVDTLGTYDLAAGTVYRLVVQQACFNDEGAWAVAFSGPGTIQSDRLAAVPAFSGGALRPSDPVSSSACGAGQYRERGPFRVERSGTYYFQDVSASAGGIDVCLQVYTAPFQPEAPNLNRVATSSEFRFLLDDTGTIELEAGRDYWFVVQPRNTEDSGEYFFVLAPPAPYRISRALAGAWFNPATNGQGFFVDVYPDTDQLFVGWYTYDLQRPVDGTAALGEPGHRWLTAFGAIEGNRAGLDVFLARGGVFDAPEPPIEDPQTRVGEMTIEFTDCVTGTVEYELASPAVSGSVPIQPLTNQHVEACELMTRGPGMPGPL